MRKIIVFCLLPLLLSLPSGTNSIDINCIDDGRILKAAAFLLSNYNSELCLICESEDQGRHFLNDRFPNLNGSLTFQNVFWLYSDNYFAYLALKPYAPYFADRIKNKVESFGVSSNLYEVVSGKNL